MTIAFLGLGRMGRVMVPRLRDAGLEVIIWNRTADRAADLVAAGARMATDPADAIGAAETILLMTDEAGAIAIVEALAIPLAGRRLVMMGTYAPATVISLSDHVRRLGGMPVECPVLGTTVPAAKGQLVALAGGESGDVDAIRVALHPLARKTVFTGPIGTATAMKLAHNLLLTNYFTILSESLALGEASGIDRAALLDLLADSPAANGVLALKRGHILGESGPIGFDLGSSAREMHIIVTHARDRNLHLPVAQLTAELAIDASSDGFSEADVSRLAKIAADRLRMTAA